MTSPSLRRVRRTLITAALLAAAAPAAANASTYTVDDDRAQCPSAGFTTVQDAIDQAAAHDTVVICDGVYRESSPAPAYGNAQSYVQQGARSALTITKPLTIRGAGADKVTIMPAPELGDSLAGTVPYLRDGGGNVISVNRQSLGSSDDNENFLDLSGVTVESRNAYVEAGVSFFNTSGRISKSVVGPLRRPSADSVATRPHGWGVVQTNSLQSAVLGGIRRQVTVEDSLVTGFAAGGVLFDASVGGADGAATNTTRSNVGAYGTVVRSRVVGAKGGAASTQTGVRYQSGQRGRVTDSEIVDVWNGVAGTGNANARASVGLLLADADTGGDVTNPGVRAFQVSGTTFGGDGYAIYNADAANAAIRNGAPVLATGNYWGCSSGPVRTAATATPPNVLGNPSSATTFCQGGSGNDAGTPANTTVTPPTAAVNPAPSLETEAPAGTFRTTATALSVPARTADAAPTAAILEPEAGTVVPVGTTISPVVQAADDFGVRSVQLVAAGLPVAQLSARPFEFSWTPTAAQAGTTVELRAIVTDSSGQTTTATVSVVVPALPTPPATPAGPGATTPTAPATPPAATPAAKRTVKLLTRSVRLDSKGRFALKVSCAKGVTPCRVRVLVKRGSAQVAVRTLTIKAGKTSVMQVRPTAAIRRSLNRGSTVTVKVSLSGATVKPVKPANVKVLPRKKR